MNKKSAVLRSLFIITAVCSSFIVFSQGDEGIKVRFNGFGDVTAGSVFGAPANAKSDTLFRKFSEDTFPKGDHQGVGLQSGYVPNHLIGFAAYGTFNLNDRVLLKYIASYGNARSSTPVDNIYARNSAGQQVTGLLELIISGPKDFRIGLSGFTNNLTTFQGLQNFSDVIIASALEMTIRESGFNPYIHYSGNAFEFLSEFHYVTYSGSKISGSSLSSLVAELAFNARLAGKRLAPHFWG